MGQQRRLAQRVHLQAERKELHSEEQTCDKLKVRSQKQRSRMGQRKRKNRGAAPAVDMSC